MIYISVLLGLLSTFYISSIFFWIFDRFWLLKKIYIIKTYWWSSVSCRPNTSDRNQAYQIMSWNEYSFIEKFLWKKSLTILDIWGNIWLFTLWVNENYNLHFATIVEPDISNRDILQKNIHDNDLINRTNLIPFALHPQPDIDVFFDDSLAHDAKKITDWSNGIIVKTTSLKKIMHEESLIYDLVKIDIEWGEYALLNEENKPIFLSFWWILLEYHHWVDQIIDYFWYQSIKEHKVFTNNCWLIYIS